MENLEIKKINESREVAYDLLSIYSTMLINFKCLALKKEFIEDATIIIQDIMNCDNVEQNINYFVNNVCRRQDLTYNNLRATLSGLELYQSTINYFEKIIGKWDNNINQKELKKITLTEFWASKEKLAIHCDTEEKANKLLETFHKLGKKWCDDTSYLSSNEYYWHKDATCYSNLGGYAERDFYKKNSFKIYELDEVDLEN